MACVSAGAGGPVLPDEGLEGPPADLHCPIPPPPLLPLPPGVTSVAALLWGTQGQAQRMKLYLRYIQKYFNIIKHKMQNLSEPSPSSLLWY